MTAVSSRLAVAAGIVPPPSRQSQQEGGEEEKGLRAIGLEKENGD